MAIERIVDTSSHDDDSEEQRIEVSLRPQSFAEYVGQERLKRNLRLAIDAAKKRGEPLDHCLLYTSPYDKVWNSGFASTRDDAPEGVFHESLDCNY